MVTWFTERTTSQSQISDPGQFYKLKIYIPAKE
jgi:hypothetical protein